MKSKAEMKRIATTNPIKFANQYYALMEQCDKLAEALDDALAETYCSADSCRFNPGGSNYYCKGHNIIFKALKYYKQFKKEQGE